jgi:hypothetical protein
LRRRCSEEIRVDSKEVAGIIIVAKSDISGKTYYLAIPQQNETLTKLYQTDVETWDRPMSLAYAQIVSVYLGNVYCILMTDELQSKKIE